MLSDSNLGLPDLHFTKLQEPVNTLPIIAAGMALPMRHQWMTFLRPGSCVDEVVHKLWKKFYTTKDLPDCIPYTVSLANVCSMHEEDQRAETRRPAAMAEAEVARRFAEGGFCSGAASLRECSAVITG